MGAYRDDAGKPYVLPSVQEAEKRILAAHSNKEYAGIAGMADFVQLSLEFAYGKDSKALKNQCITGVQTISGTGGMSIFIYLVYLNVYPTHSSHSLSTRG